MKTDWEKETGSGMVPFSGWKKPSGLQLLLDAQCVVTSAYDGCVYIREAGDACEDCIKEWKRKDSISDADGVGPSQYSGIRGKSPC